MTRQQFLNLKPTDRVLFWEPDNYPACTFGWVCAQPEHYLPTQKMLRWIGESERQVWDVDDAGVACLHLVSGLNLPSPTPQPGPSGGGTVSVTDAMSRLARCHAEDDIKVYDIPHDRRWTQRQMADERREEDCDLIATAFADPAPIDEAWLREMGGKDDGDVEGVLRFQGPRLSVWTRIAHGRAYVGCDDVVGVDLPTRGRFRALLHGLGMEVRG